MSKLVTERASGFRLLLSCSGTGLAHLFFLIGLKSDRKLKERPRRLLAKSKTPLVALKIRFAASGSQYWRAEFSVNKERLEFGRSYSCTPFRLKAWG